MNFILDTCAFFWLACQPAKLSALAKSTLNHEENQLYLSDTSIWEIALKHRAGKLPLPSAPRLWIPEQIKFFQLSNITIEAEDLILSAELQGAHADPFDRLIAAHSINRQMAIITPDTQFQALGSKTLW